MGYFGKTLAFWGWGRLPSDRCRGGSAILLLYLVTAKLGGIPRRGPTTRLAALDAGRIPNRKGTSRCV